MRNCCCAFVSPNGYLVVALSSLDVSRNVLSARSVTCVVMMSSISLGLSFEFNSWFTTLSVCECVSVVFSTSSI